jgi:hypothetical protein
VHREGAAEDKLRSDCHFTHRPETSYPLQSSNFLPSNVWLLSDQFASHSSRIAGNSAPPSDQWSCHGDEDPRSDASIPLILTGLSRGNTGVDAEWQVWQVGCEEPEPKPEPWGPPEWPAWGAWWPEPEAEWPVWTEPEPSGKSCKGLESGRQNYMEKWCYDIRNMLNLSNCTNSA